MANTKIVRVDSSLIDVFGHVGRTFANKIKKEYKLDHLFITDVLASQLIAGKYRGAGSFNFRVRKTGPKSGTLELL